MRINGERYRTIWRDPADGFVRIIDQTRLPHEFVVERLDDAQAATRAIADMLVRGAPLIGVTAAYGLALALSADASDSGLARARDTIGAARPTAVNLRHALYDVAQRVALLAPELRAAAAFSRAAELADEDVAVNAAIGAHGLGLLQEIAARRNYRVNILTHCNAGWLATVDWGTATAPIYKARDAGLDVHVFVDETRPRNQGAALTAFELAQEDVPHTVIVDNAGGHLMQQGEIDIVIVGTDRTTANGDVANKIGTYLKALAARDNGVPFYVAAPSSSIDFSMSAGAEIPIEERSAREVTHVAGRTDDGRIETVRVTPAQSGARNPAFDVTPARLVSGLITERGVFAAERDALAAGFPERA